MKTLCLLLTLTLYSCGSEEKKDTVVYELVFPPINQETIEIDKHCFRRCCIEMDDYLSLDELEIVCKRRCKKHTNIN